MVPEIITLSGSYGGEVDWHAVGVLFYEILGGKTPFFEGNIKIAVPDLALVQN